MTLGVDMLSEASPLVTYPWIIQLGEFVVALVVALALAVEFPDVAFVVLLPERDVVFAWEVLASSTGFPWLVEMSP